MLQLIFVEYLGTQEITAIRERVTMIKRLGNSTIYSNHCALCGHSLGKPHGMMESFHYPPPPADERSELTCIQADFGLIKFLN